MEGKIVTMKDILSGEDELCDACPDKTACESRSEDNSRSWMYSENFALCHSNGRATYMSDEEFG